MRTRPLGTGGPEVSVVGLGCNNFGWRIGADESRAVVDAAIEAGITLLDTADVYGETQSESFLGEALEGRHDRVVLLTKFGHPVPDMPDIPRGSAEYVRWAVEGSLRRLQADAIDIYMYHKPDGITPVAETIGVDVRARPRRQGEAHRRLERRPRAARGGGRRSDAEGLRLVGCENRYSLVTRDADADIVPACVRLGVGLIPFYPLESGILTGKYRRGEAPAGTRFAEGAKIWPADRWLTDDVFDKLERLAGVRRRAGRVAPRRRDRRPRRDAGRRLGDRRRDEARAGRREREGRRLGAGRRRAGRARRALIA